MGHPNSEIRLLDGEFYAGDPHAHLAWMRENAPVYWDEVGQVWGISLYDDVMAISKNPQTFSNREGIRPDAPSMPYMINLDDPDHKRRRNLVNKGFTRAPRRPPGAAHPRDLRRPDRARRSGAGASTSSWTSPHGCR